MDLNFYTSVEKGLKVKVRKILGLIPKFIELTGEKMVKGPFCPILNSVKAHPQILRKMTKSKFYQIHQERQIHILTLSQTTVCFPVELDYELQMR